MKRNRLHALAYWLPAIAAPVLLSLALVLHLLSVPRDTLVELQPDLAVAEEDPSMAWYYPLAADAFDGGVLRRYPEDSLDDPRASTLSLFINGERMGPPHTPHATVRSEGGGTFSHWRGSGLLFSLTEPEREIRSLAVKARSVQPGWAPLLILAASLAGGILLLVALSQIPIIRPVAGRIFDFLTAGGTDSDDDAAERRKGIFRAALALASLLCLSGAIYFAISSIPVERSFELNPSAVQAEGGGSLALYHALGASAFDRHHPFHSLPVDSMETPGASTLRLFVNGQEMGPPHSAHADVRETGNGSFSHWEGSGLLFSLPDGTRTVRSLSVTVLLKPVWWSPWLAIALLVAGAALTGVTVRLNPRLRRATAPFFSVLARRHIDLIRIVFGTFAAVCALAALAGTASRIATVDVSQEINTEELGLVPPFAYTSPFSRGFAPFIEVRADEADVVSVSYGGLPPRPCNDKRTQVADVGNGRCQLFSTNLWLSMPGNVAPDDVAPIRVHHRITAHPYLIAAGIILACVFGYGAVATRSLGAIARGSGAFAVALGSLLLLLNLAGFVVSPRPANIEKMIRSQIDIQYTANEALQSINRRNHESDLEYTERLFDIVSGTLGHDIGELPMPATENWLLHVFRLTDPNLRQYLFWDPRRTLARGLAQCGPASAAIVGLLEDAGVNAQIVGLEGHVVATAEVEPGRWHVLDVDHHVHIPHSIDSILRNTDVIERYYMPALEHLEYDNPRRTVNYIHHYYSSGFVLGDREAYFSGLAWGGLSHGEREALFYRLKWLIPISLLALGASLIAASGRRKPSRSREKGNISEL